MRAGSCSWATTASISGSSARSPARGSWVSTASPSPGPRCSSICRQRSRPSNGRTSSAPAAGCRHGTLRLSSERAVILTAVLAVGPHRRRTVSLRHVFGEEFRGSIFDLRSPRSGGVRDRRAQAARECADGSGSPDAGEHRHRRRIRLDARPRRAADPAVWRGRRSRSRPRSPTRWAALRWS